VCIMCVHLTFEGEKQGLISSFLLFFLSYIEGSFYYSLSCFIFMHFPICDRELCLCFFLFFSFLFFSFSCSTYVLMSFVECFRKHDTFCQFVTKGGSKNWGMMDDSSD
jgi:hypothetical protein